MPTFSWPRPTGPGAATSRDETVEAVNLAVVASELYGLDPEAFTAARNARAKEAAGGGDRVLAAEIRKLGKPTAAAWLANGLARSRASAIEELIGLGPALRRAQSGGRRAEMKEIVERRRALIGDLVKSASEAAGASGHSFGSSVERQLEETLEAAVADPVLADALGQGRLTEPLRFVGFGESPGPGRHSDDHGGDGPAPVIGSTKKAGAARKGESAKQAATARRVEAAREAEADRRAAREALEALDEIEAKVEKAQARRVAAAERLERASKLMKEAEAEEAASTEALRQARQGLGPARRRLKKLGRP